MHRVGSSGNTSNSVRNRKEKRLTYVLNDADDTKHCAGINCLAVSKSTEQEGSDYLFTGSRDGTLKRWELSEDSATFSATFESHVDWVNDAVLTGGNTLVSCSSDTTVKVWNRLPDGICARTFHQHSDYVTCLAAAEKNSNVFASGGLGGEVFIWDLEAALNPISKLNDANADDCSTSTNGLGSLPSTSLRPINSSNNISVHATQSQGYVPIAAKGHKESVYALATNDRGTLLVSGGTEKVVRVWDPRSGSKTMKLRGHTENIRALLLDSTGRVPTVGFSFDMATFARPENALKRAEELINVGQKQEALEALHSFITSRRYRAWTRTHEKIMFKYVELCVDMRRGRHAKDGLIQYRGICQQVNITSLEEVIKHFMQLATEKAELARNQAQALEEALDVDDLEADKRPEDLLLSYVSGEKGKDRSDRELVTPWFKFLWETYRSVLEILRNNSRLEALYAMTAHRAFQFCKQYKRTTEFRRLCEIIRNHLTNLNKYRDQRDRPDLSVPESLQLYLDTRFEQLKVATELELWQEAFRLDASDSSTLKESLECLIETAKTSTGRLDLASKHIIVLVLKLCQSPLQLSAGDLFLSIKLLRNLCAGEIKNQNLLIQQAGVVIISTLINTLGLVSGADNRTLYMVLQLLGNVSLAGEQHRSVVWHQMFPLGFLDIARVQSKETCGALCMVIYTCIVGCNERSVELLRDAGLDIVVEIIRTATIVGCREEHWMKLLLLKICLEDSYFSPVFSKLYPVSEAESSDANVAGINNFGAEQALLLRILSEILNEQLGDIVISNDFSLFLFGILRNAVGIVDFSTRGKSPLPTGSADVDVMGYSMTMLRDICAYRGPNVENQDEEGDDVDMLVSAGLIKFLIRLLHDLEPPAIIRKEMVRNIGKDNSPSPSQSSKYQCLYRGFRRDVVSVVGNCSYHKKHVQDEIREQGGILLLLQQCVTDEDNPFLREWGIWSMRNVFEGNEENQELVAQLELQRSVNTFEIAELGLRVEVDPKTQRPKLVNA